MRSGSDRSYGVVCMITVAGAVVSSAWPIFLAAIPFALGALLYLFRAKGAGQPQVTSTLFLLSRLPQYTPSRRRFVPPLQFWLELALALALALAASGVMSARTGERVAIIIDTSKSMAAYLGPDETRLEAAVRIAAADIAQASADTRFTVVKAGRTLVPQTLKDEAALAIPASDAINLVRALKPTYEADNLGAIIPDALSGEDYDSVWLYTDRYIEGSSRTERLRVTTIPYDSDSIRNIWISSVAARKTQPPVIEVGVSRVGPDLGAVLISVSCTDRVSGETFAVPSVTDRIGSRETKIIRIEPISRAWSYCRLSIEGEGGDLLTSDNEAWLVRSDEKGELGVISDVPLQELGIERVPYGKMVSLTSSEVTERKNLKAVVYHRATPISRPKNPTMVVYPNSGSKLWGAQVFGEAAKASAGAVEITRWDESHPILQYVRPGLMTLPTARILECPVGAQALVYSVSGPILCAGEDAGERFVIVGFEVFPFDGLKTPTLSILTLNALQWLLSASEASSADFSSVGMLRLPQIENSSLFRLAPRSEQIAASTPLNIEIAEPGILAIIGANSDQARGTEQLIAVNAISDQESDLALQAPVDIPIIAPTGQSIESERRGAGQEMARKAGGVRDITHHESMLAWAAFIVVVLDLLRRIAGRASWRGQL